MVEVECQGASPACRFTSIDSGVSDLDESDGLTSSWASEDSDFGDPPRLVSTSADTVKDLAVQLAHEVVRHMTKQSTKPMGGRHAKTLRRMVDELSTKHEILFASLVKKLELGDRDRDCEFLSKVAQELFSDKQYNWGRLVTLYTFAGWLARHCVETHLGHEWPGRIADKMGRYIAENMSQWITSQGGWDTMDEYFREPDNIESKVWRGLLYTVLGLGALATTVAVVR